MMTKKDFIALADAIREAETGVRMHPYFLDAQLDILADFCAARNPRFNYERWLGYIRGECGPNGGAIRKPKGACSE